MSRVLLLDDGAVFRGTSLGSSAPVAGEVVFTTSMTGYQEVMTDPSYAGQIVTFTYPLIGNYGINDDDFESDRFQPRGVIVHEACETPSNWRSRRTVEQYLEDVGATGIQGIDTRALTQRIRERGVAMGAIAEDEDAAQAALDAAEPYGETDFVREVTTKAPYRWGRSGRLGMAEGVDDFEKWIAVLDCGVKNNILRRFAALKVGSIVFPATASADQIAAWNPDGLVISPGPGDPQHLGYVVSTVGELLGTMPILGICLGNQVLSSTAGGKAYKLKFGHRGANHPVKDLEEGGVTITSQNHGYAVDPDSIGGAKVTQVHLNDGTVSGIRIPEARAWSVQYHPEAAPGPWDARKYFRQFVESLDGG